MPPELIYVSPDDTPPPRPRIELISPWWQFWRKRYGYWWPAIMSDSDEDGASND